MTEKISGLNSNERFYLVIVFGICISLVEVFSQYSLKSNRLLVGLVGYIVVAYILFKSYNYEALGHMNLIWSCISIILCFIVGVFVFKEPFNKYTFMAVCFALIAIYLGHLSDECG